MELFSTIVVAAILGLGLALAAPVSVCVALNFDRRPTVTIGMRFLIFKHHFPIKKKKKKARTEGKNDRPEKSRRAKKRHSPDMSPIRLLPILSGERDTLQQSLAALGLLARRLVLSTDRYYLDMNLSGGMWSPDLTGQLFGLVQACRSIPSNSLSLSFHPDFSEDRLHGTIAAGTVFRIYRIINQLLIFIWRLPIKKLLKLYRNYRKETGDV